MDMNHAQSLKPPRPLTPPLDPELVDALTAFWADIFETPFGEFGKVLRGSEQGINNHQLYLVREHAELVATTLLTISGSNPRLAGLGEVATATTHRGRGLAAMLTRHARDTFLEQGGAALFLGTVNPAAARIYHRLGWRKLASANVMCLVRDGGSPEEFLVDTFRTADQIRVAAGTPACRVDMIPLILCPHDDRILDINVSLFSTRYSVQNSCMGLFPRYHALPAAGGQWFTATTEDGRVVGLATARPEHEHAMRIDGFAHPNFPGASRELLTCCLQWVDAQGGRYCLAEVAQTDTAKRELFESLDFCDAGAGADYTADGQAHSTRRLQRQSA